ncbi:FoF1 ATP synthase subunit delta [Clostridium lamae]|uniref:F0F1 ATP synthase subunit delta n=1 Tax=Clostridium TaxID=1485 RepID=UPI00374F5569
MVKTTVPLTEEEYGRLISSLEKKYGKRIILEQIIDKEIMGGIYIKINDDVIDGTVEGKISKLKKSMFISELR